MIAERDRLPPRQLLYAESRISPTSSGRCSGSDRRSPRARIILFVAPVLRRVTAARIDFLTSLYQELGHDTPEARRRALLAYAIFVGGLELVRVVGDIVRELTDEEQRERYFEHAMRVLTIDTASGP